MSALRRAGGVLAREALQVTPSKLSSSLNREMVEIEPRAVSAVAKARIIARDGRCKHPGCDLTEGLEVDHIVPLALGGKNADWNLACLCGEHHRRKTAADVKAIAKAKRVNAKHNGTFPPPLQRLRGRGFKKRWDG